MSAFGGVLAFNRAVDGDTATEIAKTFIEAIAAPGYSSEALAILGAKELRLLRVTPGVLNPVVKSITGGYLVQTPTCITYHVAKRPLQPNALRQMKNGLRSSSDGTSLNT